MSAPRCTKRKRNRGTVCGAELVERRDLIGRLSWDCPACARRAAGICADCPRPVDGVVGRAERCKGCRAAAKRRDNRNWKTRDPEKARLIMSAINARLRDRKRGGPPPDPAVLAVRRGYARAAALTPERRKEISRLALKARWDRVRAARREQQQVAA